MTDSSDHWVRFDPAGCAHSSAYVTEAGLLAEDAYKTFVPKLPDRRREAAEGWTLVRLAHPDWLTQAGPCFYGTCRHQAAAKTTEVRGLTVRQPWAWALLHGKTVENRSWPLPTALTGATVLLHAGMALDRAGLRDPRVTSLPGFPAQADFTTGAVIAVGRLRGCHFATGGCCAPWGDPETFHWELTDLRPLPEPVPAKGKLGLWRLPADLDPTTLFLSTEEVYSVGKKAAGRELDGHTHDAYPQPSTRTENR
ncbi:ASCH domain-containing protein [Streptomyces yangpuensis]|uniref:hypothetical protein n=1 Tax=Streptomyces yangpuensis TaxID=1648182 RepID=UPI00365928D1